MSNGKKLLRHQLSSIYVPGQAASRTPVLVSAAADALGSPLELGAITSDLSEVRVSGNLWNLTQFDVVADLKCYVGRVRSPKKGRSNRSSRKVNENGTRLSRASTVAHDRVDPNVGVQPGPKLTLLTGATTDHPSTTKTSLGALLSGGRGWI